jgi:hypothetical protein
VSKVVIVKPRKMRRPRPPRGCCDIGGKKKEKKPPTDNNKKTKVKYKVVPVHATKAYRGRRGTDPLILKLGTRWR